MSSLKKTLTDESKDLEMIEENDNRVKMNEKRTDNTQRARPKKRKRPSGKERVRF